MNNLEKTNKTEEYEFINLKKLFLKQPNIISKKYTEYNLVANFEQASEVKNFISNADAIFKSKNEPFIYFQNSSFENNFYIKEKISKDNKDFKSLYKTVMIGEKFEGKELIMSLINSLNKIFKKKSNYKNFPDNKKSFAYLYLTCNSLLEFSNNSFEILIKILNTTLFNYIQKNNLNNHYKKIIITFNPYQVNINLDIDVKKNHKNIDERTRNIELNLLEQNKDIDNLIEIIKDKIKMHEYFLEN